MPFLAISPNEIHKLLLNLLCSHYASNNRDNSGTNLLFGYTGVNALLNKEKALILYLSSTQFRSNIPWDTSFVVKGSMIELTNLTEQPIAILSSMIV
jgi:hypothetical protein